MRKMTTRISRIGMEEYRISVYRRMRIMGKDELMLIPTEDQYTTTMGNAKRMQEQIERRG